MVRLLLRALQRLEHVPIQTGIVQKWPKILPVNRSKRAITGAFMRSRILDCPVDILTREETLEAARYAMKHRQPCMHVSLNVAKLINARTNGDLAGDIATANIVSIDGMGIALALRLMGHDTAPRLAGIDMFDALMDVCAAEGYRPFLLGASKDVLTGAIVRLKQGKPALNFAGAHHGYFDGHDTDIVRLIQSARPDCLFLAMPSPRKERFMAQWKDSLDVPFVMGIGGTLDVISGKIARAPPFIQRAGFEWLYRLAQEPRRMWRRYLSTNLQFAGLLVRAIIARIFITKKTADTRDKPASPAQ